MTEQQTYQANIIVPIPREQLVDLLDLAAMGIGYWAASMSVKGEAVTIHEYIEEGRPETRKHVVSLTNIAAAVEGLASGKHPVRADIAQYIREALLTPDGELGELDPEAADVVVQYAVFEELVYG